MAHIVVIGGGISGLSAAYYLTQASRASIASIVLLEASPRLGGWVHSQRCHDGAVFELGPRTLRPYGQSGLNTFRLAEELGLRDKIITIPKTHPAAQKRFVLIDGSLHQFPSAKSFFSPFPAKPFKESLMKIISREALGKYLPVEDESIDVFISKHFGPDMARFLINPLCRGIFAGDSAELSARSCFPALFDIYAHHGSVVRGSIKQSLSGRFGRKDNEENPDTKLAAELKKTSVWSLSGGLQDLTDALIECIVKDSRVEVRLDTRLTSIGNSPNSSSRLELETSSGDWLEADHAISSVYARDLASALRAGVRDFSNSQTELALTLEQIPAVTVCVVNLEYSGKVLPFDGFGFLIPSFECEPILGCVFDSSALPTHDSKEGTPTTRLTVMIGGSWYEKHFGNPFEGEQPLAKMERMAVELVRNKLNVESHPRRTLVNLQKNCIPQYLVGHHETLSKISNELRNSRLPLSLVGSSYKGPSVNDCIFNTKRAIQNEILPKFRTSSSGEQIASIGSVA